MYSDHGDVVQNHWDDIQGNPAGGATFGQGFAVSWQNGPLGRGESRRSPNGAFVEDVILAAVGRLEYYQSGKFACEANAEALDHLRSSLEALNKRTADRERRGVEGLNEH